MGADIAAAAHAWQLSGPTRRDGAGHRARRGMPRRSPPTNARLTDAPAAHAAVHGGDGDASRTGARQRRCGASRVCQAPRRTGCRTPSPASREGRHRREDRSCGCGRRARALQRFSAQPVGCARETVPETRTGASPIRLERRSRGRLPRQAGTAAFAGRPVRRPCAAPNPPVASRRIQTPPVAPRAARARLRGKTVRRPCPAAHDGGREGRRPLSDDWGRRA